MKIIIIKPNESEQRLDKFLKKYMNRAPGSFLYKMLRKKNITLNGRRAGGNEKLHTGDEVRLFLSDKTIEKFTGDDEPVAGAKGRNTTLDIIYEDSQVLFVNKPAGMLSQKAEKTDLSLVEHIISYLLDSGQLTREELRTFRPSVCNRLDRNTSGLVAAGKTLAGLQMFGSLFRDRNLRKYYLCIVKGKVDKPSHIKGYLIKNEQTNEVRIVTSGEAEKAAPIETEYIPLAYSREHSLLRVHLITGRTHQIRAHLAYVSHPLCGDHKYGDRDVNERFRKKYGVTSQMLHSYELVLPVLEGEFAALSERTFRAPVPALFQKVIKETAWEHGTQEALEVLHWKI